MIVEVLIPGIPGPPGTGEGGVSEITGPAVLGRVSGTGAPVGLTPAQGRQALDLGNVNNTSDANKPISGATAMALAGKEATGTAAAAIAAHLAASDPHPSYLTPSEAGALYAPLASIHDSVTLSASVADVLGLTGQQLTAVNPSGGTDRLLFYDSSTGRIRHLALGSNLTITDTTIDAAGGTNTGDQDLSGLVVKANNLSDLANLAAARANLGLGSAAQSAATDFATAAQGALAATAVQPPALSGYAQTTDSRLSDAREWSAATVTQAAAQAGTETTRRAWTVERVWQAAAAWWQSISGATGRSLAGAATPAAARTVLELGTTATTASTDYATAAQGAKADAVSAATSANLAWMGPASGSAAAPSFRALVTADLPASGVSAGTYGSSTQVPVLVVDATGRITGVTMATVSSGGGSLPSPGYALWGGGNGSVIAPISVTSGGLGSATAAVGTTYYHRIWLPAAAPATQLVCRTFSTHSGTTTVAMGIYDNTANSRPGNKIIEATVTANAVSSVFAAAASTTLQPGWYWLAFLVTSATGSPVFTGSTAGSAGIGGGMFTELTAGTFQVISCVEQATGTTLPAVANATGRVLANNVRAVACLGVGA